MGDIEGVRFRILLGTKNTRCTCKESMEKKGGERENRMKRERELAH